MMDVQGNLAQKSDREKMFLETFGEPDGRLDANQTPRIRIGGRTILTTEMSTR
jgi:hypothetical protein